MFIQTDLTLEEFERVKGCKIDFLKSIDNSKRQMKFLRVPSDSQQFTEWLKKETTGNHALHV